MTIDCWQMRVMPNGLILAFDFGLKWIGVASGQTITASATPLTTLGANNGKVDDQSLLQLVNEWQPTLLLVGLPLNMDDTENPISKKARKFAQHLETLCGVPVELVDERLSSREAADRRGKRRTGKADDPSHAEAAVVIAETWLNAGVSRATGDQSLHPPQ